MISFSKEMVQELDRPSSKGNQLKWKKDGNWYKADYAGYEGLSEYVCYHLLNKSTLEKNEFVSYEIEQINYNGRTLNGCVSKDFLGDYQLITLERLFRSRYGISAHDTVFAINDKKERLKYLVDMTVKATGLTEFGEYIAKAVTMDYLFLNEDRHMHNIAVLMDKDENFMLCPLFDFGGSLLSDTTLDYPLSEKTEDLMNKVRPKTFSGDFEEQVDIAEQLFGRTIKFNFTVDDIEEIITKVNGYTDEIKERVRFVLIEKRRQLQYLF